MKILQCIESMNPSHGGTVESTCQMAKAIQKEGACVEILTLDEPSSHWGSDVCTIHRVGPPRTQYAYSARLQKWLRERALQYDAVVVNGIWRYHSVGVWWSLKNCAIPYYVIPHGMLNPWFNKGLSFKQIKKTVLWRLAESQTLQDARAVLYSSEEERRLARSSFKLYRCREVILPLGTADPKLTIARPQADLFAKYPELIGKRLFLFLGRLHRAKACDQLLQALAQDVLGSCDVHLVMAGPDSEGWQRELELMAANLGIASRITWTGSLSPEWKWTFIRASELLVLPSHCESIGYSAIEALASGVPVLISNKVNIYRELLEDGCAVVGDDTVQGTTQSLRAWLETSAETKRMMSANARKCFLARYESELAARRFLTFLSEDRRIRTFQ